MAVSDCRLSVCPPTVSVSSSDCFSLRTAACVRPLSQLGWFVRMGIHDGDNGAVFSAATSFDQKYLLSCGGDGIVAVMAIRAEDILTAADEAAKRGEEIALEFHLPSVLASPVKKPVGSVADEGVEVATTPVVEDVPKPVLHSFVPATVSDLAEIAPVQLPTSSVPTDVHNEELEEKLPVAADIVDPSAYSIQDSKLKTEEDLRKAAAERKKTGVRATIAQLREEMATIRADNDNHPDPRSRLSEEELLIDPELFSEFVRQGKDRVQEVR
jgi:hypothetical protein